MKIILNLSVFLTVILFSGCSQDDYVDVTERAQHRHENQNDNRSRSPGTNPDYEAYKKQRPLKENFSGPLRGRSRLQ